MADWRRRAVERYMRELAEVARSGLLTPEAFGRLAARHDLQLVRPLGAEGRP